MKLKRVSWNWGSFIFGIHYGRNPTSGKRFLYIGLGPFLGLDFCWPEDDVPEKEKFTVMESCSTDRPIGTCPLGTPGCCYADCSPAPGHACYGGHAPKHADMFQPDEIWSE